MEPIIICFRCRKRLKIEDLPRGGHSHVGAADMGPGEAENLIESYLARATRTLRVAQPGAEDGSR